MNKTISKVNWDFEIIMLIIEYESKNKSELSVLHIYIFNIFIDILERAEERGRERETDQLHPVGPLLGIKPETLVMCPDQKSNQ